MANRRDRRRAAAQARKNPDRRSVDDILALVAQPVPPGSGVQFIGQGPYTYMKTNALDGSTRAFRFELYEDCQRAMAIGMAADTA